MPPKFVPRQRKHKVKAREAAKSKSHNGPESEPEANQVELLPTTATEKDERRSKMREELRAQQAQPKVSSKKRKRLDKYIDNKLKKEENLELIKKLAAHKVDTSLFASSKKLGRGGDTARERMERALAEKAAGINVDANDAILFEERKPKAHIEPEEDSEDEDEDEEMDEATVPTTQYSKPKPASVSAPASASAPAPAPAQNGIGSGGLFGNGGLFGSGLKRPLDVDDSGKPIIQKRKRRKVVKTPVVAKEPEWEGFSSEGDEDEDEDGDMDDDDDGDDDDGEESEADEETTSSAWDAIKAKMESDETDAETKAAWEEIKKSLGQGSDEEDDDDDDDDEDDEDEDDDDDEEDSDEDDEDDDSSPEEEDDEPPNKSRSSAFKSWAIQQRNQSIGFVPSNAIDTAQAHPEKPANFVPRAPSPETLPPELSVPTTTSDNRPAVSLVVPRTPEIQEARLNLPVVQEEQKIMEAIHNQDVIVVWGATGSGKTTQVPQMMFESGYGSKIGESGDGLKNDRTRGVIGVTQPRRVAAVSVAERVGTELCSMKDRVGYQIRFDTSVSKNTAIKFMTDGILLREIANDFILSRYSAVVIDEAHERSVNTDILIGMMSRIVDLRAQMAREEPDKYYPLKLVIMSATLRIEDFTKNQRLFRQGPPPIVKAEGRQFPVTVHFARRTQRDYVDDMFHKITKGHKKLPPGGMLCFLTGQNEIVALAKRLRHAFPSDTGSQTQQPRMHVSAQDAPLEVEDMDATNVTSQGDLEDDGSDDEITGLDDEDDNEFEIDGEEAATSLKVHVLPLYSQLPTKQQLRVFEDAPEGSRLIVLATNVAETSLTIPGVRYVFDCGRSKEKKYEPSTGVQTFEVSWISKASAAQRSGRAGRTGPGHCYRLYSSAVYERDFEEYAIPEILRSPIEGVVLSLKAMDIQTVVNFPFPTPPDRQSLAKAEKLLTYMGAIDSRGKITETGKELAAYPLSPRFARMLLLGQRYNLTAHATALVAALAVPEMFIPQNQYNTDAPAADSDSDSDSDVERPIRTEADNIAATAAEKKRKAYGKAHATLSRWDDKSDALKLLTTIAVYSSSKNPTEFCEDYFVRDKAMKEATQLRQQLSAIVRSQSRIGTDTANTKLSPPDEKQRSILKQLVAAGFIDNVAIRSDLLKDDATVYSRKPRRAIEVAYRTLFPSHFQNYVDLSIEERELQKLVYVHPSSVLAHLSVKEMPDYIIYSHLSRSQPSTIEGARQPKTRMHPLTDATAKQLANLADGTPLLEVGKPIGKIESLARGKDGKERRQCWVGLSLKGGEGMSWPVGARKVVQVRIGGVWETESVIG